MKCRRRERRCISISRPITAAAVKFPSSHPPSAMIPSSIRFRNWASPCRALVDSLTGPWHATEPPLAALTDGRVNFHMSKGLSLQSVARVSNDSAETGLRPGDEEDEEFEVAA